MQERRIAHIKVKGTFIHERIELKEKEKEEEEKEKEKENLGVICVCTVQEVKFKME